MSTADPYDDLFDDEEDERLLEQWAEAERHAAGVVTTALASERGNQPPASIIAATAGELRAAIRAQSYPVSWVARAAGLAAAQPDDDAQLLLDCAAATISPREDTGLDAEEESMLFSLELADWAGVVIELVRDGAGAAARPRDLVAAIDRCPEIDGATGGEDIGLVEAAMSSVQLAWMGLGLIDRDDRLTEVGAWVLPRALTRAWGGDFDAATAAK
jgi:hypothetical protein